MRVNLKLRLINQKMTTNKCQISKCKKNTKINNYKEMMIMNIIKQSLNKFNLMKPRKMTLNNKNQKRIMRSNKSEMKLCNKKSNR